MNKRVKPTHRIFIKAGCNLLLPIIYDQFTTSRLEYSLIAATKLTELEYLNVLQCCVLTIICAK